MVIATTSQIMLIPQWKTQELVLPNNYKINSWRAKGPQGAAEIRVDYLQDVETF